MCYKMAGVKCKHVVRACCFIDQRQVEGDRYAQDVLTQKVVAERFGVGMSGCQIFTDDEICQLAMQESSTEDDSEEDEVDNDITVSNATAAYMFGMVGTSARS